MGKVPDYQFKFLVGWYGSVILTEWCCKGGILSLTITYLNLMIVKDDSLNQVQRFTILCTAHTCIRKGSQCVMGKLLQLYKLVIFYHRIRGKDYCGQSKHGA